MIYANEYRSRNNQIGTKMGVLDAVAQIYRGSPHILQDIFQNRDDRKYPQHTLPLTGDVRKGTRVTYNPVMGLSTFPLAYSSP